MAIRFYLAPKTADDVIPGGVKPKYTLPGDLGAGNNLVGWQAMDYGLENVMLLVCDVTTAQNTALTAKVDVTVIPANLNSTLGAQLATVQAKLEAFNLPGNWVTSGMTYRQVLKAVRKVISFMQRYRGQTQGRIFIGGVTLATTFGALTEPQRQQIRDASDSFGLDYSTVTGSTTIRAALKLIADQLPDVTIGGEVL